jgi:hypothetical protein
MFDIEYSPLLRQKIQRTIVHINGRRILHRYTIRFFHTPEDYINNTVTLEVIDYGKCFIPRIIKK